MSDPAQQLFDGAPHEATWLHVTPRVDDVLRRGDQLLSARRIRRRALFVAVVVLLLLLGPALSGGGGWRHAQPLLPLPVRPVPSIELTDLPAADPPASVPYAIGDRIFWKGSEYPISASTPGVTPTVVHLQPVKGLVLALVQVGDAMVSGVVGPGTPWHLVGDGRGIDVTLNGDVVTLGRQVQLVDPDDGAVRATLPAHATNDPGTVVTAHVVGDSVLVSGISRSDGSVASRTLWNPATGSMFVLPEPGSAGAAGWGVAQRRLPGWLARPTSVGCVRLYTLPGLDVVGVPVCGESTYALSWSGDRVVVVRAGRLVVTDVASGRVLSSPSLARVTTSTLRPNDYVRPLVWETPTSYLVAVRVADEIALVRCSEPAQSCERAVTSHVRPGVSDIYAGW